MNFFRLTGIAAACATLIACSSDSKGVAGSSLETENSIAFQVNFANNLPASKAYVIIHDSEFFAEDQSDINLDQYPQTNEDGVLELDSLPKGKYVVEVRGSQGTQEQKGATTFEIDQQDLDSGKVIDIKTGIPASFKGNVYTDKSPVWVMIRGLEYRVPVDSLGNFAFESLPEGVFEFVLVHSQTGKDGTSSSTILAESKLCVGCDGDAEVSISIIDRSAPPRDTATVDTTTKDTIPTDTLKHFMFEDFEKGKNGWYKYASEKAEASLNIDSTEKATRGYIAHFTCVNDSAYNWCLMGHSLGGPVDMSELDSIVFWAKGKDMKSYLSFSLDIVEDSTLALENGKSWTHIELTEEWARYTVTPETMQPASDENGGNLGWDAVKENITNISIFGGAGGEFWIDDIEIFGYEKFTPKAISTND
jgi:hypothetical protein